MAEDGMRSTSEMANEYGTTNGMKGEYLGYSKDANDETRIAIPLFWPT